MKEYIFENKKYGVIGNLNKDDFEYLILVDENIQNIVLTKINNEYVRDIKHEKDILKIINNQSDILYSIGNNNFYNNNQIDSEKMKNELVPKIEMLKTNLNINLIGEELVKTVQIKIPNQQELEYIKNLGIHFDDGHFACYDPSNNIIFVNENIKSLDEKYIKHIICHELVHLYSTNTNTKQMGIMLKDYSGRAFNEGITELITNYMLQDEICVDVITSYQALGLTKILDFMILIKSYFENDSKTIINELLKLGNKMETAVLINSADITYNMLNNPETKNLDNKFLSTTTEALIMFYLKKEIKNIHENLYNSEDELLNNISMFKNTILDSKFLEEYGLNPSKFIGIDNPKDKFYELIDIVLNEYKNPNPNITFNNEQVDEINSYRDLFPKR